MMPERNPIARCDKEAIIACRRTKKAIPRTAKSNAPSEAHSMSKITPRGELKPWDPRPWPNRGDVSIEVLYAAAGRALSQGSSTKAHFLYCFRLLCRLGVSKRPAALIAQSERSMVEGICCGPPPRLTSPRSRIQILSRGLTKSCRTPPTLRRADIAHAVVDHFISYPPSSAFSEDATYCLYRPVRPQRRATTTIVLRTASPGRAGLFSSRNSTSSKSRRRRSPCGLTKGIAGT
jgi:hypothetical protein